MGYDLPVWMLGPQRVVGSLIVRNGVGTRDEGWKGVADMRAIGSEGHFVGPAGVFDDCAGGEKVLAD